VWWFAYYYPESGGKKKAKKKLPPPHCFQLHHVRDGFAFAEISSVLGSVGYGYEGTIMNYPTETEWAGKWNELPSFRRGDLIIQTTRPPLHDERLGGKRKVPVTGSALEKAIFDALAPFFAICDRSCIELSDLVADHLEGGFRNRRQVNYCVYRTGTYGKLRETPHSSKYDRPPRPGMTAGFLVYIPNLPPSGVDLLSVFGMGGNESTLWSYFLRTKPELRNILEAIPGSRTRRFLMAEFSVPECKGVPMTLSFADSCDVDVVLDLNL